ncbi:MAG: hypothetical protein VXY42_01065 [Candidatus Thermoplasmatota archaeon]|nr:hypothetical protein [Candidatus Thermoplasmatota archaeon]MEC7253640.1 hypothetical protein [Candidatus Thermoplasmatota archaeon]MEC8609074.1 hypothetical protein [Candidatus Thermoplasmatota archaeon]
MSDGVPEGATLPEGIEVDDAAAYFGVTESSDVLQQMMSMDSKQALSKALEHLADIVLRPGEFDFEAASERLQCEGGEIYFLIFGHLNLMALPDPLLQFAGQPDSSGATETPHPLATADVIEALTPLFDPMQFLKILAIAYITGGHDEVDRYHKGVEKIMASPSKNVEEMKTMAEELNSSLDVAGHALPMSIFASEQAQSAEIELGSVIEREEVKATSLPQPEAEQEPEPVIETLEPKPVVDSVPLPTESVPLPDSSVPLPTSESVPLPELEDHKEDTGFKNEVEVDYAAQDAFAGAFGSQLVPEPKPTVEPSDVVEETNSQPDIESDMTAEPLDKGKVQEPLPVAEEVVEEEWVSDAERFIAADIDESGSLSVEELAVAANVSIQEAEELHSAADTDGDGEVSLSEFVSSEAAEKMSSLPRPVAPIRKPIQPKQPPQQQQPVRQQPVSPGVAAPQMGWQQPAQQPMQQQPMMPQQPTMNIQPTIRSGIHCRGCGIGLDPNWRYCPVCGNMNMSAHR